MKFQILFFFLLLTCMYPSLAQGSYENCCLKYVVGIRKSLRKNISGYIVQKADGGCNIPAIVFQLKKSKTLCADPRKGWVKELIMKIDLKNE
ncbi:C-C motif chemokine 25b [Triplophysa rosa]|uniref:Chemokine CCL-C11a n=1 Tax=Triplophysa rosa TaxID=992332 RepID=A0A9W7WF56_TRIRA|nr:C-C motif chemokine 25b [Triplophysa rosa]KAI7795453.1 chemokine CCL-C11a [Triplophysa rosa]